MGTDMGGDLFAPWHIIILLVVLVVLFGAKRLPGAAQSLGQSMHIFKKSVQGLHAPDDQDSAANPPPSTSYFPAPASPAPPAVAAPDATAQQLADLQRQVQDLQRQSQSAGSNGQASEAQTTQPL
jgi:sec-independent protein translocase protein TatA